MAKVKAKQSYRSASTRRRSHRRHNPDAATRAIRHARKQWTERAIERDSAGYEYDV